MGDSANVIDRIDVHGYDLTYAHGDYVMSSGRVVNVLPSTVVRIRTRGGVEGFGESLPAREHVPAGLRARARGPRCASWRRHSSAWTRRTWRPSPTRMDATLRGHEYAKSAIDVACWDILGRATGQSVATLLGGAIHEAVPLYVAVPLGPAARCRRSWSANGPAGSTTSS